MIRIRAFAEPDWPAVWKVIQPVFQAGETCALAPDITEAEAHQAWVKGPTATYVAEDEEGRIVGVYFLKPNQPGLGSHVCNCGYIVDHAAQGRGIATLMCEHSQREAVRLGFRAMQFNLVVATNTAAVHLWQKLGFTIVGAVPGAFLHAKLGFVEAYVMYKQLVD